MELSFIVIDDSELDCFIARKIIEHTDERIAVQTFLDATDVLDLIKHTPSDQTRTAIILMDLQMPLMSGFEFLEEFEKLPVTLQQKYLPVVLSSTRNSNDIARLLAIPVIRTILEKPLTREKLFGLIMKLQAGDK